MPVCGSRVVVTPYARFAAYAQTWSRWMSNDGRRCACVSTKPGTIVLPATSITCAPPGTSTVPRRPTAAMRLSRTTTSASSITSSPRIVTTRAPRSTATPSGVSRRASTATRTSTGLYSGFSFSSSFFSAPAESAGASRFSASASALAAASTLSSNAFASSRSYTKCALPIDQCTVRPSALQAGNWPPMSVSLRTGKAAFSGFATEIVGTSPPITGTVMT